MFLEILDHMVLILCHSDADTTIESDEEEEDEANYGSKTSRKRDKKKQEREERRQVFLEILVDKI